MSTYFFLAGIVLAILALMCALYAVRLVKAANRILAETKTTTENAKEMVFRFNSYFGARDRAVRFLFTTHPKLASGQLTKKQALRDYAAVYQQYKDALDYVNSSLDADSRVHPCVITPKELSALYEAKDESSE